MGQLYTGDNKHVKVCMQGLPLSKSRPAVFNLEGANRNMIQTAKPPSNNPTFSHLGSTVCHCAT